MFWSVTTLLVPEYVGSSSNRMPVVDVMVRQLVPAPNVLAPVFGVAPRAVIVMLADTVSVLVLVTD
jgi:hypothetical protein